jgi:uncharacterized protein
MRLETRQIRLPDATTVSAEIALPAAHRPGGTAVILAHGAGNDMRNPLLTAVHRGLAERGLAAVKFNFPYTEQKRRAPDRMPVLEACFRAVIDAVRGDDALRPKSLVLGGKSMGGRVASHLAAQGVDCAGLVFLGYPLHPAGKPEQLRTAHLARIRVPMLFFAGTRDSLCRLDLLQPAIAALKVPVTLHVIEGGDHSFKVLKSVTRHVDVAAELADVSSRWISSL